MKPARSRLIRTLFNRYWACRERERAYSSLTLREAYKKFMHPSRSADRRWICARLWRSQHVSSWDRLSDTRICPCQDPKRLMTFVQLRDRIRRLG
jgi:hypothetical protein